MNSALAALMLLQAAGLPPAPQWRADAPIPPPSSMEKAQAAPGAPAARAIGVSRSRVPRSADGHFYVDGLVNGVGVRFVVDTGAGMVMLTPQDAMRAGVKVAPADYDMLARTAGGSTRVAPVKLASVAVGQRQVSDVFAVVSSVDTGMSLLGMSFLRQLKRVTIENDVLDLE